MSNLDQLILSTIVYYDIFDYPLTLVEIHRNLLRIKPQQSCDLKTYNLCDIKDSMLGIALKDKIREKDGFFFLCGRDRIVKIRLTRYVLAKNKYDKAKKVVFLLSHIPFVRAILACNSIAYNNTKDNSDIDLCIITKKGGVWWARAFCLIILSLFNLRPTPEKHKNKFCLSFFIDEDNLNLKNLRIADKDIDFVNWVTNFYPLYDYNLYYNKFWKENYSWIKRYLPYSKQVIPHNTRIIKRHSFFKKILEFLLFPFTFLARNFQKQYFPYSIRKLINCDTRVRVEEGLLKFHVNDRRLEHLEEFVKRYERAIS